ncbi:hypothetical protein [Candidatus Symbiobacter mobilis]|uniref:Phage baseplate assembly protein V n=1 Tax=Candidatus Symbiobacter mobilis CR TaxID=946483 RepID=U5N7Y1_9BURK|nr:hypothetical protein [Candidatus Symbiobacter mobilis]AGX87666.1 hypothetical protein Cenrod_1581 [Candidatus Symbiobacter mobilis CR]
MEWLFVGRVIDVHQHDNSLDVLLVYDGSRLTGVPVLSPMMTTSSGVADLHEPEGNEWESEGSRTRDAFAVLARTAGGGYLVIGFLPPQVTEIAFDRRNFRVERHASDVYRTTDDAGNTEYAHPSGTFLRIAEQPEHEDLTGKDFDGLWKITRNKNRRVWLAATVANSAGVQATLRISPDGDVSLDHVGALTVRTAGKSTLHVDTGGNVSLSHSGNLGIDTAGNATWNVDGSMTINAPTVTINGVVSIHGGGLTHNSKNVGDTHAHSGVLGGPSNTGAPV